jgi:hypothetical protein
MGRHRLAPTDPHEEIDHQLRVRRLELQLSVVADALRLLAEAADTQSEPGIAGQIEEMLDNARL